MDMGTVRGCIREWGIRFQFWTSSPRPHRMPDTALTVMTELHRNAHAGGDIEVGVSVLRENPPVSCKGCKLVRVDVIKEVEDDR